MKKIINIVYAFSKTEKTFKRIVTAMTYDQLKPIMERRRNDASWFVYNIKHKTIHDMYAAYSPGKIAFFRKMVQSVETKKAIEYSQGVRKGTITKKDYDKEYKAHLDYIINNTPKHILYAPFNDSKAIVKDILKPYIDQGKIIDYMEKKRNLDAKLKAIQDAPISEFNLSNLENRGFTIKRQNHEVYAD